MLWDTVPLCSSSCGTLHGNDAEKLEYFVPATAKSRIILKKHPRPQNWDHAWIRGAFSSFLEQVLCSLLCKSRFKSRSRHRLALVLKKRSNTAMKGELHCAGVISLAFADPEFDSADQLVWFVRYASWSSRKHIIESTRPLGVVIVHNPIQST